MRSGTRRVRLGGVPARELGGQRRGGDGPQESVGHLGVHLQRRDPRRYVQGVLVHGRRDAVVGQLQVHAVRNALGGHHTLQHVEGRLVCVVGETRGQRALQRGDAASVRGHLPVRGGQGRRRGQGRNCRRQRAAVQL